MSDYESINEKVIELWEDLAESRGFNRVLGRILYILLLSDEALTQQDIREETGYSIPTISRTLNTLVSLGSVRKTSRPGSRLTYFSVNMKPHEIMSDGLKKWVYDARNMQQKVSTILEKINSDYRVTPESKRLLKFLTELHDNIPRMIDVIENSLVELAQLKSVYNQ